MAIEAGQRIVDGRYTLESQLGVGGFGEVWRARDLERAETVAIKFLHPELADDDAVLERFEREIRIGVWLRHEAIPEVVDAGVDATTGRHFFAMRFVPGEPLGSRPLSLRGLLRVFEELTDVLAFAHARGLIHRDLKPENVLVVEGDDGAPRVRLLDFGIVRVTGGALASLETDAGAPETTLGSLYWMSPEQASGESASVGPSSDLYSLGCMLFEQITGAVPFAGTLASVIYAHIIKPPPPLDARPGLDVPDAIETDVAWCLAKRYADRPEFAAELGARLRAHAAALGPIERDAWYLADAVGTAQTLATDATFDAAALPDETATIVDALPTGAGVGGPRRDGQTRRPRSLDLRGTHAPSVLSSVVLSPTSRHRSLARLIDPPLVGRERELGALDDAFAATADAARLVVIQGAPGAGKSRLVRAWSESLHEMGSARVVRLLPGPSESLASTLRRGLLAVLRNPKLEREPVEARVSDFLGLSPETAVALTDQLLGTRDAAVAVPRPAFLDAVLAVSTRPKPLPIVVWLDGLGSTHEAMVGFWLRTLLRRARAETRSVLVVWTLDPGLCAGPPLAGLADVEDRVEIELSPLADGAQRALALALEPRLAESALSALGTVSDGHPGQLRELVLGWQESGQLELRDGVLVPRESVGLAGALTARVDAMHEKHGEAVVDVLTVLALLRPSFSPQELGRAFERAGIERVELVSAGLLSWTHDAGAEAALTISSPALRDVLLQRWSAAGASEDLVERAAAIRLWSAHRALQRGDWGPASVLAESARNLFSARVGAATALECHLARLLIAAGQREAPLMDAYAEDLGSEAPSGDAGAVWREHAVVWHARASLVRGDLATAEALLADHFVARDPGVRAHAAFCRGLALRVRGADAAAIDHFDAACVGLRNDPPRDEVARLRRTNLYVRTQAEHGEALRVLGELDRASAVIDDALSVASEAGAIAQQANLHLSLARIVRTRLDASQPQRHLADVVRGHIEEAAQIIDTLDDLTAQATLVWEAARLALVEQAHDRALRLLSRAADLFGALGQTSGMMACQNSSGELARSLGRLDDAERYYAVAADLARRSGNQLHLGAALYNQAVVAWMRGDLARASVAAASSLLQMQSAPLPYRSAVESVLAELERHTEGADAALERLLRLAAELDGAPVGDKDARAALGRLAEADARFQPVVSALLGD